MDSHLILIAALCLDTLAKGFTHVGQSCNKIFRICLASNAYCDDQLICRCKPKYPVMVGPHTCTKGKHFGEQCKYSEECRYYDANSYCTQLPYSSICECHDDYVYSESNRLCEEVSHESSKPTNLVLPYAIGLSLTFAVVLCGCMILWHICQRRNFRFLSRPSLTSHPRRNDVQTEGNNPSHGGGNGGDEALPNYYTAVSLKSPEDECEPPPSYEEVIQACGDSASKV